MGKVIVNMSRPTWFVRYFDGKGKTRRLVSQVLVEPGDVRAMADAVAAELGILRVALKSPELSRSVKKVPHVD